MKQGPVRLLYNFGKRFMGWTLHMIMCVLLCYPVSIHMAQLLSTGRPISSFNMICILIILHNAIVSMHTFMIGKSTITSVKKYDNFNTSLVF